MTAKPFPMLLWRDLHRDAAGLANSVYMRAKCLSDAGEYPVILTRTFQPWLREEVAALENSGRFGMNTTTTVRNLFEDLSQLSMLQPLEPRTASSAFCSVDVFLSGLQEVGYELVPDPQRSDVTRCYRDGEYRIFLLFREEKLWIADLLMSGKRFERREWDHSGTLRRITEFDEENRPLWSGFLNDYGEVYLENRRPEGVTSCDQGDYFVDGINIGGLEDLWAYWLEKCCSDLLRANMTICEWAFDAQWLDPAVEKFGGAAVYAFHNNHSGSPYRFGSPIKPELISTIKNIAERRGIVVLTEEQRWDLLKAQPNLRNIYVIPHAAVPPSKAIDIESHRPVDAVMVSRLSPEKGHAKLLSSLAEASWQDSGACLHIYGRGPEEEHLRTMVSDLGLSDSVIFEGFTRQPYEVFRRSKVALFPSAYEGQCLSLMECMASGCVPVAFRFKYGANAIIRDGVDGFIVDPDNWLELIASVRLLLERSDLHDSFQQNAIDICRRFGERDTATRWIDLRQRLLSEVSST